MNKETEITVKALGWTARDRITGFKGIVIAVTFWLNGCVRICIQPQELKDGKPVEAHTFDAQQVIMMEPPEVKTETKPPTGGPKPEPTRNADPTR